MGEKKVPQRRGMSTVSSSLDFAFAGRQGAPIPPASRRSVLYKIARENRSWSDDWFGSR